MHPAGPEPQERPAVRVLQRIPEKRPGNRCGRDPLSPGGRPDLGGASNDKGQSREALRLGSGTPPGRVGRQPADLDPPERQAPSTSSDQSGRHHPDSTRTPARPSRLGDAGVMLGAGMAADTSPTTQAQHRKDPDAVPGARLADLLRFLAPYRRRLLVASSVSLGGLLGIVAIPLLLAYGVDAIDSGDRGAIVRSAVAIVAVAAITALSQAARQIVAGRLGLDIEYDLRNRLYSHLQDVELRFIEEEEVGQLVSRGTVDLRPIRFFLGAGLPALVQDLGTIVLAAVVMFVLQPDLAALTLAPVVLIVVGMVLYNRAATPRLQLVRRRIGALASVIEENVQGVRLVRGYVRERLEIERFRAGAQGVAEAAISATRVEALFIPTLALLPAVGLIAVLLFGGNQAIAGSLSVGEFTAFFTYALLIVEPAGRIAYWLVMLQAAVASTARLNHVLDHQPEVASAAGAADAPAEPQSISFEGVQMSYEHGNPVLEDIHLEVGPKRAIAIAGATGSGKSTLLGLINRLYDPESGSVLVGGRPTAELDLRSLRSSVAAAVDDDFLFAGSVRENIAYGSPGASDIDIQTAAERAQAHDFIAHLPDGYEARLTARGHNLSGGQRQRISLARALLAAPSVLLLDNATASLDAHTERRVLEELKKEVGRRTTVIVAYRAPSLALADEVVVLEDGKVVAVGTHESLIKSSDAYRSLLRVTADETPMERE